MSSQRTILITGATGEQGGVVLNALLDMQPKESFCIVAVTRSRNSNSAQSLVENPNISLVEGDLDNPDALFQSTGPVWGVFSVQVNSNAEETQGKALVDAAIANGVSHFVYASGDRGGPVQSPQDPTTVPNFIAKYKIEKHLEKQAAVSPQGMTYTVLRPVTFFENQTVDMHDKKLQMVSTKDIVFFGAYAFLHPNSELCRNGAISIAGDELNHAEAAAIFKEAIGTSMPMAPCPVGSALKFFVNDTIGAMFKWFEGVGYGADVEMCRKMRPGMQDYWTWLKESSGFVKAS
ncbi:MAG: hypothetical protein MMC33_010163 [Icmadophila ericetorum]|nr:hypothetical protein [Icmadophila ericetorum]